MNIEGLVLPYPISANRYWRTRAMRIKGTWQVQTYLSKEAVAFKAEIKLRLLEYGVREPIKGRVTIGYRLYPHRPIDWQRRMRLFGDLWDDGVRCMDLGNVEKIMSDALEGLAITNDAKTRKLVGERMEPDGNGERLVLWVAAIAPRYYQQELLPAPATRKRKALELA